MQQNLQPPQEDNRLPINLARLAQSLIELIDCNTNLRMKYPDEPMRFYPSEEEISAILEDNLTQVGQSTILMSQSNILLPILTLLSHPNNDITATCISFLHELLTEEPEEDSLYEVYFRQVVSLSEKGLLEGLVTALKKMNEESVQEYEVVLQALKVLETVMELHSASIKTVLIDTSLLEYLANRIMPNFQVSHKTVDDNKYVSSDLLSLLLTASEEARDQFHSMHGMEILIESVSPYAEHAPKQIDEQEYLNNLFDCLNLLLINPNSHSNPHSNSFNVYHGMQGNSLMIAFLRQKNETSVLALKAMATAFGGEEGTTPVVDIVAKIVEAGGLKYVFAVLMRKGVKGGEMEEQRVIDEHVLRIIYELARGATDITKARVQSKLSQNRCERVQKLFQLRNQYAGDIEEGSDYLNQLKEGLTVVEIIDKILSTLVDYRAVRNRLKALMTIYQVDCASVEMHLQQSYRYTVDPREKRSIQGLLSTNVRTLIDMCKQN